MYLTPSSVGATALPKISAEEAKRRRLLTRAILNRLHLQPGSAPVAFSTAEDGTPVYYFDPDKVTEAEPEEWIAPSADAQPNELPKISARKAQMLGLYTEKALAQMYYQPIGGPVAVLNGPGGELLPLFEKTVCRRLPLPCVRCGRDVRYRTKLCRKCYLEQLAIRRAQGDARRNAPGGMDPAKVLYFDLEMTGVYQRDEVLSVSIINGYGETVLESYTAPEHVKRWHRTEKIHGITPEMVKDAPTLSQLAPKLREIIANADRLIAFGTATDYSMLCRIYDTEAERQVLHGKLTDCAAEFSHFLIEHEIELPHQSLTDAMDYLGLPWDGVAHSSAADTRACRKVFETLFPHYYERQE